VKEVISHQEIVKVAHDLFERSGRAEGHDLDNWLKAERIVMTRHRQQEKLEAKIPAKKMTSTTKERSRKIWNKSRNSKWESFRLEVGRTAKGCQPPIKGGIWGAFPDGQWQFSQEYGVGVIFVDELWYARPLIYLSDKWGALRPFVEPF
jgi:hypothetical protein